MSSTATITVLKGHQTSTISHGRNYSCFLDKNKNKSNAMCDHAHIQLEKEYSNTDFICNHKPVAQRVLQWENAFFKL